MDGLGEFLEKTCTAQGRPVGGQEVMADHVHLFIRLTPADAPRDVGTGRSSRILRSEFVSLMRSKVLSKSGFVARVGDVSGATVRRYIENQWAPA